MTDRLKPCPFCGGEAEVFQISTPTYEEFVVVCKNHNCCAFYIGYGDVGLYPTEQKAIEKWNTRKPIDKIVEELEAWAKSSERLYFEYSEEECYGAWRSYNKAIEIIKEGGKDVTTRNDTGMD